MKLKDYIAMWKARARSAEAALGSTRQILAEYPDDPVLQLQAQAIDKLLKPEGTGHTESPVTSQKPI
jgi:hypothetical protein